VIRKQRKQVIFGIEGKYRTALRSWDVNTRNNPVVDPEAAKYVLDEMIAEAGVNMLYHTWASNVIVDGNVIKGVIVENKSGRMAILSKV